MKEIDHEKEFARNGIIIGKPKKGFNSISRSLFEKFVEQFDGKKRKRRR